jgi:hypothetical protein
MNEVLKLSWDIANKSKDGNGNDNGQIITMVDDKTNLSDTNNNNKKKRKRMRTQRGTCAS